MSEAGGEEILRLIEVTRRFGEVTAVDRLSLSVREGEIITLLGPSGCGKTTALRLIAGFEVPDGGRILFEGKEITRWTPQQRGFGMVFQSYALFPHLNVFENVAFGLRARKAPTERIRERVAAALEVVDLAAYPDRSVQALSGGQQQRVAVARAIAIEPPLLLLDEPLSNLDQALRVRTRTELRELVKGLGITALFVTHDQEEAFDLSDRIAVMEAGRIRQIGTPEMLYQTPADRFVAGFVGRANVLVGRVERGAVRLPGGIVWPLPDGGGADATSTAGASGEVLVLFRPEDLRFVDGDADPALGTPLPGWVRDRRFRGGTALYQVEIGRMEMGQVEIGQGAIAGESEETGGEGRSGGGAAVIELSGPPGGPEPGSEVRLQPRAGARLHLFPRVDAR